MSVVTQPYDLEMFDKILADPAYAGRLLELVEGEIREKMPTEEHGTLAGWIVTFINLYLMNNPIGHAGVEISHRLPQDQVNQRLPDVSFMAGQRIPLKKGSVPRMPDLAVEIQSPDDTAALLRQKAEYYLKNGSQMVWLVYPSSEHVDRVTVDSTGVFKYQTLGIGDDLAGDPVLPDFRLPIKNIFAFPKAKAEE